MVRIRPWFGVGALAALWAGKRLWAVQARSSLRGKVVLITGGSRGLGFELARAFGTIGCRVVICARDATTLARAEATLRAEGLDVQAQPCDVTDRAQVDALIAAVTERMGQIDMLVCCAVSSITVGPAAAHTVEDFEAAHAVLYWGIVYPTMAVLPQMLARGDGRIVMLSSVGGKLAVPHMLAYSGAKFAALGFGEGLANELVGTGVSVTRVAPGVLRTGAHLHARYVGRPEQEFVWFSSAELGPVAVGTRRAAQQIVSAAAVRAGEVIFPLSSLLAARLHGAFPNSVAAVSAVLNRLLLPKPTAGEPERDVGLALDARTRNPLARFFAERYRGELRRLNQYPEEPVASKS